MGKQAYYKDEDLSLYLLGTSNKEGGGRYYDPESGRFLSKDPKGFAAGDANLYRYVKNNPINVIDPSGHRVLVDSTPDMTDDKCSSVKTTFRLYIDHVKNDEVELEWSARTVATWQTRNAPPAANDGRLIIGRAPWWDPKKAAPKLDALVLIRSYFTQRGGAGTKVALPAPKFWETIRGASSKGKCYDKSKDDGSFKDVNSIPNSGKCWNVDLWSKSGEGGHNGTRLDDWWGKATGTESYHKPPEDVGFFTLEGAMNIACAAMGGLAGDNVCETIQGLEKCSQLKDALATGAPDLIATLFNRGPAVFDALVEGLDEAIKDLTEPAGLAKAAGEAFLTYLGLKDVLSPEQLANVFSEAFAGRGDGKEAAGLVLKFFKITPEELKDAVALPDEALDFASALFDAISSNGIAGAESFLKEALEGIPDAAGLATSLGGTITAKLKEIGAELTTNLASGITGKLKRGAVGAVAQTVLALLKTVGSECGEIGEFFRSIGEALKAAAEDPSKAKSAVKDAVGKGFQKFLVAGLKFLTAWLKIPNVPEKIADLRDAVRKPVEAGLTSLGTTLVGLMGGLSPKPLFPPILVKSTEPHRLYLSANGAVYLASDVKTLTEWIKGWKTTNVGDENHKEVLIKSVEDDLALFVQSPRNPKSAADTLKYTQVGGKVAVSLKNLIDWLLIQGACSPPADTRPSSATLGANLESGPNADVDPTTVSNQPEAHHIVSGSAGGGGGSRSILSSAPACIGINDAINGVWLPKTSGPNAPTTPASTNPLGRVFHNRTFEKSYQDYVFGLLNPARGSKSGVENVLRAIRRDLIAGAVKWPQND